MLSAIHETFGDPSKVLKMEERPLPEPGPGEIRIRTGLAAIHNHDLLTVAGTYGYKPPLPAIGGSEAMGVVDALGEGVSEFQVGQRVAASGRGTWAQFYIAKAAGAVPLPNAIADETAAQLIAMPMSAMFLLDFVNAHPGSWLVQNAATGAVAKVLAKVAQKRGVNVVNLVRRDEAVAELEALGIKNAVSTAGENWKAQVADITGGAPIHAAIDGVGGPGAADLCAICGPGATIVSFGLMSGKPMEIPPAQLIFRDITVKGFWLAKLLPEAPKEKVAALMGELIGLIASGDVTLQVDGIYDLADIAKAAEAAGKGKREGKVLVRG
ncbi:NADPH:quinone reductase-like Zn-dependent oxidoreductase [Breoghania corrubedonensis]|uniref:NADPH:quinone reductase-like Zn-dependent oxidoreductase n=1 Tax=Breoghania corrubedonensis TaxID=665038 RepID=A0A2T5VF61_9HYPH|nr:zinc-binding dehydrogenase [Breoghania corrubedonensis]PTW62376.1 NADPH:quinone reductase-like Zn-dependent oxidoreductase [Breoghania corrubedonensis]